MSSEHLLALFGLLRQHDDARAGLVAEVHLVGVRRHRDGNVLAAALQDRVADNAEILAGRGEALDVALRLGREDVALRRRPAVHRIAAAAEALRLSFATTLAPAAELLAFAVILGELVLGVLADDQVAAGHLNV